LAVKQLDKRDVMETTAVKKSTKKDYRKLILEGFKNHVLEHGDLPKSVFIPTLLRLKLSNQLFWLIFLKKPLLK
jgi:hypothetical protein